MIGFANEKIFARLFRNVTIMVNIHIQHQYTHSSEITVPVNIKGGNKELQVTCSAKYSF